MIKNTKLMAMVSAATLAATIGLVGCGNAEKQATTDTATKTEATASAETRTEKPAEPKTEEPKAAPTETKNETTKAPAADAQSQYIGEEAAKKAALDHAGFAAADVTELKAELDTDDATVHYDVDFKNGGKEYDYDIDATNGTILNFHSEVDD